MVDREIPNPARKLRNQELQAARQELKKLQSAYGRSRNDAPERRQLTAELEKQEQRVQALTQQRDALPTRVQLAASSRADEVRLSVERKLFTDVVKMAAYRADCTLVELADEHLARNADEGHAFVRAALRQPADLRVTANRVDVLFEPMSAPRFTRALTGLCAAVNATNPTFPETRYRLHFSVKNADQL
ncbi:MAG: putative transposase [Acidobacteriota bacterium]